MNRIARFLSNRYALWSSLPAVGPSKLLSARSVSYFEIFSHGKARSLVVKVFHLSPLSFILQW